MKRIIFFYVLVFSGLFYCGASAQSASGLYIGKYSGIHGAILNPSSPRNSAFNWDANLASFNAFAHTDFVFALNTNLFHLLKNTGQLEQLPRGTDQALLDPNAIYYDFKEAGSRATGSTSVDVSGPSFLMNLKSFSVGLFTRLRMNAGSHSIPEGLGYYTVRNIPRNQAVNVEKTVSAGMAWSEYGINFSSEKFIPLEGLGWGVNVKFLNGHQGTYARNTEDLSYQRIGTDTVIISNGQAELGLTNSMIEDQSRPFHSNGTGFAFDLGVSYQLPEGILNISVLDIGGIKFNNDEFYRANSNGDISIDVSSIREASNLRNAIDALDQELSEALNVNSIAAGNEFKIGMPTRLHVDYAHEIDEKLSVGIAWDQRMPLKTIMAQAENAVTLIPKYEKKWLMFSLPITLYEYQKLRVGMTAKIGFLTVGSDHLLSLVGKSDFRGSSLYAAIKIFPFGDGAGRKSKGNGKGVICPTPKKPKL